MEGDFRSGSLDFDDLMTVLGGPPDTGETASAAQRAIAANLAAEGRLLPDAPLNLARVRNMDADVSFRAVRVRSNRFSLRALATRATSYRPSGRLWIKARLVRVLPQPISPVSMTTPFFASMP